MYNVKIKKFRTNEFQIRVYSHGVIEGRPNNDSSDSFLEEIEPFSGESVELCMDFDELERQRELKKEHSLISSRNRTKQKIYDIARSNDWDYFVTFTFNPNKVNRFDYDSCVKKLSKWLNHFKERCNSSFKYIVVPEHHANGAYHFHGLFANCEELKMTPSGHYDSKGRTIYNIGTYRFGFTTATPVSNNTAVTRYITKYTTKDLVLATKGRKRYWSSRNCDLPTEETLLLSPDIRIPYEDILRKKSHYFKSHTINIGFQEREIRYYEYNTFGNEDDFIDIE